jgi:hypothetical protein
MMGVLEFIQEATVVDCRDIIELRRIVELIVQEHLLRCPECSAPEPVLRRHHVERKQRCPHCLKPLPEPTK